MKSTNNTNRPGIMSDTASKWYQAIRGNDKARKDLLGSIMPAQGRRGR